MKAKEPTPKYRNNNVEYTFEALAKEKGGYWRPLREPRVFYRPAEVVERWNELDSINPCTKTTNNMKVVKLIGMQQ